MVKSVAVDMIEFNYIDPIYGNNANIAFEYWVELQYSLSRI